MNPITRKHLSLLLACLTFAILISGGCRSREQRRQQTPEDSPRTEKHQSPPTAGPGPSAKSAQAECAQTEVHYAPQEDLEEVDTGLLGSATEEIEITAYSFTDPKIASVLEQRASLGVQVKIYSDHASTTAELSRTRKGEPVILQLSRTPNIEVRIKRSSTLAHMKAFEVDGRILRTGSANFSAGAEKRQDNDLLIIRDPSAIASFRAKFEEMWERPDNESIR
jgi:phosphatidylserine/phosphatidylglycerophosphate/cardiolipin synthase-like enzyme